MEPGAAPKGWAEEVQLLETYYAGRKIEQLDEQLSLLHVQARPGEPAGRTVVVGMNTTSTADVKHDREAPHGAVGRYTEVPLDFGFAAHFGPTTIELRSETRSTSQLVFPAGYMMAPRLAGSLMLGPSPDSVGTLYLTEVALGAAFFDALPRVEHLCVLRTRRCMLTESARLARVPFLHTLVLSLFALEPSVHLDVDVQTLPLMQSLRIDARHRIILDADTMSLVEVRYSSAEVVRLLNASLRVMSRVHYQINWIGMWSLPQLAVFRGTGLVALEIEPNEAMPETYWGSGRDVNFSIQDLRNIQNHGRPERPSSEIMQAAKLEAKNIIDRATLAAVWGALHGMAPKVISLGPLALFILGILPCFANIPGTPPVDEPGLPPRSDLLVHEDTVVLAVLSQVEIEGARRAVSGRMRFLFDGTFTDSEKNSCEAPKNPTSSRTVRNADFLAPNPRWPAAAQKHCARMICAPPTLLLTYPENFTTKLVKK